MTDRVRRFLRWTAWSLGALVLLVHCSSRARSTSTPSVFLRRTYSVRSVAVTLPTDSSALARGERLARVRGCFGGVARSRLRYLTDGEIADLYPLFEYTLTVQLIVPLAFTARSCGYPIAARSAEISSRVAGSSIVGGMV